MEKHICLFALLWRISIFSLCFIKFWVKWAPYVSTYFAYFENKHIFLHILAFLAHIWPYFAYFTSFIAYFCCFLEFHPIFLTKFRSFPSYKKVLKVDRKFEIFKQNNLLKSKSGTVLFSNSIISKGKIYINLPNILFFWFRLKNALFWYP